MASFSAVKTTVARPAMFTAAKARFAGAPMVAKPMIIKARASRFTVSAAASSEVLGKVQGIIAEQLGTDVEKVGPDAKFVDLGADSLDTVSPDIPWGVPWSGSMGPHRPVVCARIVALCSIIRPIPGVWGIGGGMQPKRGSMHGKTSLAC